MADAPQAAKSGGGKFTIEFGDDFGRNFVLSSLAGKIRVRGEWNPSRMYARKKPNGKPIEMRSFSTAMSGMPPIPGERMEVLIRDGRVRIFDPLAAEENADLRARIQKVMKNASVIQSDSEIRPQGERKFEIDADTMKTLVCEIIHKQKAGECKLVSGSLPTEKELSDIAGDELFDPHSTMVTSKPRYKKDRVEWERSLDSMSKLRGE